MFLSRAFASAIPTLQATAEMLLWSMVPSLAWFYEVSRFLLFVCIRLMFKHVQTHPVDLLMFALWAVGGTHRKLLPHALPFETFVNHKAKSVKCSHMLTIHLHRGINVRLFESFESLISGRVSPRCWPTTEKYRNVSNLPVSHPVWCLLWCRQDLRIFAKSTS